MTRLDRRSLLKTGAAAGVLAATGLPLGATPRRGGVLRLAAGGASGLDSWDSRGFSGQFMILAGHGAVFDTLTQVAANGELIGELAESWEASADAKEWTFHLRKGVEFHNGKLFEAEDVAASLRLHLDKDANSPARAIVTSISEMTIEDAHRLRFRLASPNADFPFLLADYHLCIYPAGQIQHAMQKGIGTGLYKVISFDPGRRAMLGRVQAHYKDGKEGWFDAVEILARNAPAERVSSLTSGQVDAINDADLAQKADLDADVSLRLTDIVGNQHIGLTMRADQAPFHDLNLRHALKYAIDRRGVVQNALFGHGRAAQDQPIGPINQYMSVTEAKTYDPDKARFFLRKAGMTSLEIAVVNPNGSHSAMGRMVDVFADSAMPAGISVSQTESSQGLTLRPSVWAGRATEDWMLTMMTAGVWNASHWENPHFQNLLLQARGEFSTHKRQTIYQEMQHLMADEGGAVIPAFANFADAHHARLSHGPAVGNLFAQDSGRIIERWWFA